MLQPQVNAVRKGVAFVRPEIRKLLPQWTLIKDCIAGEVAIKEKGFEYLPYPSTDDSFNQKIDERYKAYRKRAVFLNSTRKTVYELLSQVFIKKPVVSTVDNVIIKGLLKNATGDGVSFEEVAKQLLKYNIAYGYCGVFIDYPHVEGVVSKLDIDQGRYRPTVKTYSPFEIVNFKVEQQGTDDKLTLVVLNETASVSGDDGFETKSVEQYRVLKLVKGVYIQELWQPRKDVVHAKNAEEYAAKLIGNFEKVEVIEPVDVDGKPFDHIPFKFIGSENNNPYPDNPIMYDLASLNVSHYRNSADYEESLFVTGQPTLVLVGLDKEVHNNTTELKLGARKALIVKDGGSATLLQMKADTGLKEGLDKKEKQMASFGAKFLEPKNIQMTAYQVKVENQANGCILADCANNVSIALTWVLDEIHNVLKLAADKILFELNTDFSYNRMPVDEQQYFINAYLSGAITFDEMRQHLRRAGTALEDDDSAVFNKIQNQLQLTKQEVQDEKENQQNRV